MVPEEMEREEAVLGKGRIDKRMKMNRRVETKSIFLIYLGIFFGERQCKERNVK